MRIENGLIKGKRFLGYQYTAFDTIENQLTDKSIVIQLSTTPSKRYQSKLLNEMGYIQDTTRYKLVYTGKEYENYNISIAAGYQRGEINKYVERYRG